jgi:hypothetical protein
MMQKVFDFLKMLRTLDKNAEAATKELLPGLEITHQECSFDPSAPWYDSEFKYLGEVFTLRYLVTDKDINNCCILELIHDGKCIDLPCEADSNIKKFIIDNFLYKYQECIEIALGEIFFWIKTEVGDSNEEFEVKGTIGDDTVGRFDIVFYVHPTSNSCSFDIYDGGTLVTTCSTDIPLGAGDRQLYTAVKEAVDKLMADNPITPGEYARLAIEKIFDFTVGDERDGMVRRISREFVERYIKGGTLGGTSHYIDTNDCDAKVFALEVTLNGNPFIVKFKRYDLGSVAVIARTGTISAPGATPYVVTNLTKLDKYLPKVVSGIVKGTKELYIEAFNKRMDECAEIAKKKDEEDTFAVFNDIARPAEIVGYYLATYGNEALAKWKENTEGKKSTETMDAIYAMFLDLPCQVTKKAPCPFCSGEKVHADFSDAYMMRGDAANIMVVYSPDGTAQAKFTIKSCPVCKKDLED